MPAPQVGSVDCPLLEARPGGGSGRTRPLSQRLEDLRAKQPQIARLERQCHLGPPTQTVVSPGVVHHHRPQAGAHQLEQILKPQGGTRRFDPAIVGLNPHNLGRLQDPLAMPPDRSMIAIPTP